METSALLLITVAVLFLVLIVGLLSLLIFKLFRQSPDQIKELHFCPNHINEPAEILCAICDKLFCKSCIKPYKSMHLCLEHFPVVMAHEWDEVLTLKTSTEDPEQGVRLYDVKKMLFEKDLIPTFIETHYKIHDEQDQIETYLVLFSTKEDVSNLKEKLRDFIF